MYSEAITWLIGMVPLAIRSAVEDVSPCGNLGLKRVPLFCLKGLKREPKPPKKGKRVLLGILSTFEADKPCKDANSECLQLRFRNPKPRTLNPEPWTLNPKP